MTEMYDHMIECGSEKSRAWLIAGIIIIVSSAVAFWGCLAWLLFTVWG